MQSANVTIQSRWSEKEREVISDFVDKVRNAFGERVKKVILYGSRARGDADEESDFDFIVLLEPFFKNDSETLSYLAWEVSYKYNELLVTRAIQKSEFREGRFFYFYENVCKEGIEL